MKKTLLISSLFSLFIITAVLAIPAQRGVWRTAKLADGTEIRLELQGDENLHYWRAADGRCFTVDENNVARLLKSVNELRQVAQTRVSENNERREAKRRDVRRRGTNYEGKKRGLIILAEFTDRSFAQGHNKALFLRIANEKDFTHPDGFKGSIHDYFLAQSNGKFDLSFDVVGTVKLKHDIKYYGAETGRSNDTRPGEMVAEACMAAKDSVNFADYDWDGDGEVDQVYVIYAGFGQASGGAAETIWPHEWALSSSDYGRTLSIDGVVVDTYACSNELEPGPRLAGIGTACHEFSHCLGFPDMYDTVGSSFGMNRWDLMDYGSYNGRGYTPAGYTSYERMEAGWLEPIVLKRDTVVEKLEPLSENGASFIIYNESNNNEYYLLENRKKTHWDAELPGEGLLVLHVDYDNMAWAMNRVNVNSSHQRCTVIHADNSAGRSYSDAAGDPYPYEDNDSLTATSLPRASVFNTHDDGSDDMRRAITKIQRSSEGNISFTFQVRHPETVPVKGDTLFYESFDQCEGIGGNDSIWAGSAGSGTFKPDYAGWTTERVNSEHGANKCAKFGTSSLWALESTPRFTVEDSATITFYAAPWGAEQNVRLNVAPVNNSGFTISPSSFRLKNNEWTLCTATIKGTGTLRLSLTATRRRFFLDEVLVMRPSTTTGIREIPNTGSRSSETRVNDGRIYSLDGRFVGTNLDVLKKGVYIVGGKKVVKP